jgi:hypothetical protein
VLTLSCGIKTDPNAAQKCYAQAMQFIQDDKLPVDVVRKEYNGTRHALCCLACGMESSFDPRDPRAIGRPLLALLIHKCQDDGD